MPVESAADRAVFVNPDEFGVTAAYAPAGETDTTDIDGQFFEPFAVVMGSGFEGPGMEASRPVFVCRSADLPSNARESVGDVLTLTDPLGVSRRFLVRTFRPDGSGMTAIAIEEEDIE